MKEARQFVDRHIGPGMFNVEGWMHIVRDLGGKLPVVIKAVPEGSAVDVQNVLMTIENTDPQCYWLTNYLETLLLKVWYPITVATLSHAIRKVILAALHRSGDPGLIDFKLHDFGYRGVSSEETAGIGAAAHLINFKGTDTVAGIRVLQQFYQSSEMEGFSIPAAEHSTITAWGRENEVRAYDNMLTQFPAGPGGRGERLLQRLRSLRKTLGRDAARKGGAAARERWWCGRIQASRAKWC